jgi:hypothetical protein
LQQTAPSMTLTFAWSSGSQPKVVTRTPYPPSSADHRPPLASLAHFVASSDRAWEQRAACALARGLGAVTMRSELRESCAGLAPAHACDARSARQVASGGIAGDVHRWARVPHAFHCDCETGDPDVARVGAMSYVANGAASWSWMDHMAARALARPRAQCHGDASTCAAAAARLPPRHVCSARARLQGTALS